MDNNHDELSRAIGRLEGKVDGILEQNKAQFKLLYSHQKAINDEVIWRASVTGKAKIILLILGSAWTIVMAAVTAMIGKVFK